MCSLTGYAEFGREVVSGLERLGIDIYLELTDYSMFKTSAKALQPNVVDLIERTIKDIPNDIPVLNIGTPPEYHPKLGSFRVGIGLFEAFGMPEPWLVQMNSMDLIITLSEFNKSVFRHHGLSESKIEIIPPAIDSVRFAPNVPPFYINAVRPFTILFVGQLILRKGWDKLLTAAMQTFGSHDDVCIILKIPPSGTKATREAAVNRLREVKQQAGGSKVPVYYNDYAIPVEQVPRVYQAVRKRVPNRIYRHLGEQAPRGIFALPSLGEGIGLPYLEAQASGLLTLGTNSTGQEFVTPDNAIIIDSGPPSRNMQLELEHTLYRGSAFPAVTVAEVSKALMRAYNLSDAERTKIEHNALEQARQMTYDKCVQQIADILRKRL